MFFLIVFGTWAFILELRREEFSTVVEIAIHVSIGRVWAEIYFLEKFILIHYRNSSNRFGTSSKNFSRVVILDFWKSRGTYWGKNCLKNLSFYIFSYLDRKFFSASRQKDFVSVVKKAFYVSWRTCWGLFWKKEVDFLSFTTATI